MAVQVQDQPGAAPPPPSIDVGPSTTAVILVSFGILAVVVVTLAVAFHYAATDSQTTLAILGVSISAITTLTGTAFGIYAGAKAGTATGTAAVGAAASTAALNRLKVGAAAQAVQDARRVHTTGMKAALAGGGAVPAEDVNSLDETLIALEAQLRAIAAG
jgi:peptidoglycan biosynthesis protein MviN/MurJ (putative lipid II flippase)